MRLLPFIFLFFTTLSFAQITGKVTDVNQNPLSFVSIYLDGTVTGTTSNEEGDYSLSIQSTGSYTVVFQFLGYKTLRKKVNITQFPFELNTQLEEESITLSEVSISTKENPANEIIRNVIANKDKNTDKFKVYTAKFYSRGLFKIKNAPEKFLGQSLGDFGGGLDSTRSGIIYLSETISNIKYQKNPKRFSEKIVASKISGRDNGISFNRAEDANINFYDNSVEFGNDLVSPISTNAFSYYTYKLIGTFYEKSGKLISKIKVMPKRENDRVFVGDIYIVEDDWTVYGVDFTVTGIQVNIPAVDKLYLKQNYNYSTSNDAWVLISQTIDVKVDFFGFKFDGRFSSAYSEYNFNPNFDDSTFTNEVLSFEKKATEKDSVYWQKIRPVPLTLEEVTDYKIKDSIKVVRKSKKYLDSLNKIQNQFNFLSPILGYNYRNSYEDWSLNFSGLIDDLGFNTVKGFNTSLGMSYFKRINDQGKWWNMSGKLNYGFSDNRLRPVLYFNKRWNNFSRPTLNISLGVETPQFNERSPISKLNNLISSLLYRNNFLKIYEKQFVKVRYSEEIKNGIYFNTSLEFANRKPLFNTTNYSWASEAKRGFYTSNNPLNPTDFVTPSFEEHSVGIATVGATFVFNQKYLSYPDQKFNLGNNKYPTLNVQYRKTFGARQSRFNSDAFIASLRQYINFGNYGAMRYYVRGGMFLEKRDIALMDQFQTIGNVLRAPIGLAQNSFNLLPYYEFFSNDRYAEAHLEHNFRGAILGRLPLVNKLNFNLVLGAKSLTMPGRNPYSEFSVGLDNLGFGKWRFLRIDYVKSFNAGIQNDGLLFRLKLLN